MQIYRIPDRDVTGDLISAHRPRDETNPHFGAWVPPKKDQRMPTLTPDRCSKVYQTKLHADMTEKIKKLEKEYALLPVSV
jgi:hypothetical protein